MHKNVYLTLLVVAVLAGFGVRTAEACTFSCSVWGEGSSVHQTTNGWVCEAGERGGVEASWEGCDGGSGGDTGSGGGGGGGGGGSFVPDLSAAGILPRTAALSQPQTLSTMVSNMGSGEARESTTRFQRAASAGGADAYEVARVATGSLAPGSSRLVGFSYTFTAPGTYYFRACADADGQVAETNEGNNCGPWVSVAVANPAPTVSLTASPNSITAGASSILSWASENADVCSSEQFDTLGAANGQVSVAPGETTLYTILCRKNGSGTTGTYKYAFSDVSDLTCPITDTDKAYTGLPTCPSRLPEGMSCTGPCKVNLVGTYPGICVIETQVYECNFTSGTTQQQAQDTETITVTNTGTDLTAGSASAPGASRNAVVSISAPILNIGGTAAGASRAYYELTAPSAKQNASGVVAMGAIPGSGSSNASFTYKFSSSGNYQVRFCADWYGEVTETNEGNNCGPWTDIAIPEGPVGDSVSCNVSSSSVTTGQSVTYTASPVGAATSPYTWTPSDGVGSYGSGQTATRTFTAPGSYGMQVGATNVSGAANCPVVTVGGGFCSSGTPDLSITATPSRVRSGQSSTITWNATGVIGSGATCTVSGPNLTTWTSTVSPAPACSTGDSRTVTVSTQSTYTLTCGAYSESVTVNVIPNFQEF